jgi:hypothetical protein
MTSKQGPPSVWVFFWGGGLAGSAASEAILSVGAANLPTIAAALILLAAQVTLAICFH